VVDVLQVDGGLTQANLAISGVIEVIGGFGGDYGLKVINMATGESIVLEDQLIDLTGPKVEQLRFGGPGGSTIELTGGIDMHGAVGNDIFCGSLLGDTAHIGTGIGQDQVPLVVSILLM
jgi:hypothetical protein